MRPASACRAPRHAGTAARTCRGSRSGPSASPRSPTTTSRATGSGTRRRSSAGARTSRRRRAATTSSRRACPTARGDLRGSLSRGGACPQPHAVAGGPRIVAGLSAHWATGNGSVESASGTSRSTEASVFGTRPNSRDRRCSSSCSGPSSRSSGSPPRRRPSWSARTSRRRRSTTWSAAMPRPRAPSSMPTSDPRTSPPPRRSPIRARLPPSSSPSSRP